MGETVEHCRATEAVSPVPAIVDSTTDDLKEPVDEAAEPAQEGVRVSRNVQPPEALQPPLRQQPNVPLPSASRQFSVGLNSPALQGSVGSAGSSRNVGAITIPGSESIGRASSDVGNLLSKSPNATGISTQRRSPIINDPRIHGSRVGSLAASGSFWIPARIDLDTAVSKFDSRIVGGVSAVPGPFDVQHGPGFDQLIVNLKPSPRSANGRTLEGTTSFDYQTNGERWHGRQEARGGDENYGFAVGYSHRTGNDYLSGDGTSMPASYNSREFDCSLGTQISNDQQLEFHYLRLDQTGVEFPGQAFDIDALTTNGYELEYTAIEQGWTDRLVAEGWYNDTNFTGSAQSPSKRREFPLYDFLGFVGNTNVFAASAGYRLFGEWGDDFSSKWTIGTDLRNVRQELNEITSGNPIGPGFPAWMNANSPIPHSQTINPGVFVQHDDHLSDQWQLTFGARTDYVNAAPRDNLANLMNIGTQQLSYSDIVGTTLFNQNFNLITAYAKSSWQVSDSTAIDLSLGHGQRAPNLTELYAAESFMFLIQNGLNTVTGDPRLSQEKRWETALALGHEEEGFRFRGRGFYAWIEDYITFESMSVFQAPPGGINDQISLKYVNTNLATLTGCDFLCEYDATEQLTPFATLQYVRGDDRTRNGNFATREASQGAGPSIRVPGLPRGFFGIVGGAQEPLPGIFPLESRVGVRWHSRADELPWSVEFAARIVDDQTRVATSLGETPTGGFTTFDIRTFWQVRERIAVIGGVENIFDRNYREHLDYRSQRGFVMLQPGISFYLGSVLDY